MTSNLTVPGTKIREAPCFVQDSTIVRTARLLSYGLVIVVSLIANSLVITIVCRTKEMKKPINFFITNMCCSDLLITTLYMPRVLAIFAVGYEWLLDGTLGLITCKMVPFLMETATSVSIFTVVVISVDRLIAVCFPFKKLITKKVSKAIIATIWLVALVVRFPVLFIKLREQNSKTYCHLKLDEIFNKGSERAYYDVVMFGVYITPISLVVLFYTSLVVALRKLSKPELVANRAVNRRKAQNRQVLKMIVAVITVSVICQILYPVVFVLDAQKVKISCELRFVRLLFAHVNCSVRPCLYFVFSKNYRVGLRKIAEVLSPQRSGRRRSTRTNDHTMSEFTRTSLAAQPTAAQFARNTQMKLKQPSQFKG